MNVRKKSGIYKVIETRNREGTPSYKVTLPRDFLNDIGALSTGYVTIRRTEGGILIEKAEKEKVS